MNRSNVAVGLTDCVVIVNLIKNTTLPVKEPPPSLDCTSSASNGTRKSSFEVFQGRINITQIEVHRSNIIISCQGFRVFLSKDCFTNLERLLVARYRLLSVTVNLYFLAVNSANSIENSRDVNFDLVKFGFVLCPFG